MKRGSDYRKSTDKGKVGGDKSPKDRRNNGSCLSKGGMRHLSWGKGYGCHQGFHGDMQKAPGILQGHHGAYLSSAISQGVCQGVANILCHASSPPYRNTLSEIRVARPPDNSIRRVRQLSMGRP